MCRCLRLHPSGFYAWVKNPLSHRAQEDERQTKLLKEAWKESGNIYGYGRHQSLEKCDVPAKIIVGVLSQGNKYAIDYYRTLISSGGTAGYCMITLPDDTP
jgi:hypothetical protein